MSLSRNMVDFSLIRTTAAQKEQLIAELLALPTNEMKLGIKENRQSLFKKIAVGKEVIFLHYDREGRSMADDLKELFNVINDIKNLNEKNNDDKPKVIDVSGQELLKAFHEQGGVFPTLKHPPSGEHITEQLEAVEDKVRAQYAKDYAKVGNYKPTQFGKRMPEVAQPKTEENIQKPGNR